MSHKFRLRDRVRFTTTTRLDPRTSAEVYEVVRLLPDDATGEPTYRIKSTGTERAVRESEIALLG
jgi:hypothetical protein